MKRDPKPQMAPSPKAKRAWRTCLKCLQEGRDPAKKRKQGGALFWSYGPQNRLCDHHAGLAKRAGIQRPWDYPEGVTGPGNVRKARDPANPYGLTLKEKRQLAKWRKYDNREEW